VKNEQAPNLVSVLVKKNGLVAVICRLQGRQAAQPREVRSSEAGGGGGRQQPAARRCPCIGPGRGGAGIRSQRRRGGKLVSDCCGLLQFFNSY